MNRDELRQRWAPTLGEKWPAVGEQERASSPAPDQHSTPSSAPEVCRDCGQPKDRDGVPAICDAWHEGPRDPAQSYVKARRGELRGNPGTGNTVVHQQDGRQMIAAPATVETARALLMPTIDDIAKQPMMTMHCRFVGGETPNRNNAL